MTAMLHKQINMDGVCTIRQTNRTTPCKSGGGGVGYEISKANQNILSVNRCLRKTQKLQEDMQMTANSHLNIANNRVTV